MNGTAPVRLPVIPALGLAAGVVLFFAAVGIYAQLRIPDQRVFVLGGELLDPAWGLLSAMVLLLGSVCFIVAGRLRRRGLAAQATIFYALTVVLAVDHVAIRAIEWMHLAGEPRPGRTEILLPPATPAVPEAEGAVDDPGAAALFQPGNAERGRTLYRQNCASCHGMHGQGVAGQGTPLAATPFMQRKDDAGVVEFLRQGRLPGDPESLTGQLMPARGGNSRLGDDALADIVAFIRELDDTGGVQAPSPGTNDAPSETATTGLSEEEFEIARTVLAPPAAPPEGTTEQFLRGEISRERAGGRASGYALAETRPEDFHPFRRAFLFAIGAQAFLVIVAAGIVTANLIRSLHWPPPHGDTPPSPLAESFWHLTSVMTLVVLPLFYFTHWF